MSVLPQSELSYEAFYRERVGDFERYLARTLGREREGAGGRIGVADTLQEAMLKVAREWPELQTVSDGERDRRLYRCLRDAAGEALRREHGRQDARHGRPQVIAYDFGLLHAHDGEPPARERELTSAVVGSMVRQLADSASDAGRRAVLDRAILLAGLRALSEREAVVLVAVDHLGWEPSELSEQLEMEFGALRTVLFEARRVFYAVARHAAGVELDEEERARLHAYQAGELSGRERRVARRHLQHCESCQRLVRELGRFGERAQRVLVPLPFVLGARVLARRSPAKAAVVGSGTAAGLLRQAGAAKALGVATLTLAVGVSVAGWRAEKSEHSRPPAARVAVAELSVPTSLAQLPVSLGRDVKPAARHRSTAGGHASRARRRTHHATSHRSVIATARTSAAASSSPPTTGQSAPASNASGGGSVGGTAVKHSSGGSGGEFFGQ